MNKDTIHTLIKDYILNKISKQELIQFLDGFDIEKIEEEYEIVLRTHFDEILENSTSMEDPFEIEEKVSAAREILAKHEGIEEPEYIENSQPFFKRIKKTHIYKIAASIALVSCLYLGAKTWNVSSDGDAELAAIIDKEIPYNDSYVPKGEKKDIKLEDGTLVKLNSDSKLSYPSTFEKDFRNVKLSGEAYFDVERDERRPFTINTSAFDIQVLGTSFNVDVHEDQGKAAVTVESGKVRVSLGDKTYDLVKNKKLVLNLKTGKVALEDKDVAIDMKWTKGILYFDKTPLSEVEKSLERWYNIEIDIQDNDLKNKKLSGQHSNETLEEVLETLAYLLEFKYEIKEGKVEIKK